MFCKFGHHVVRNGISNLDECYETYSLPIISLLNATLDSTGTYSSPVIGGSFPVATPDSNPDPTRTPSSPVIGGSFLVVTPDSTPDSARTPFSPVIGGPAVTPDSVSQLKSPMSSIVQTNTPRRTKGKAPLGAKKLRRLPPQKKSPREEMEDRNRAIRLLDSGKNLPSRQVMFRSD
ncbi:MAG: hypothetical protein M1840_008118 [Geoglossum simile]|nr:MAG: hypothetical protein M1840_008118 [Geoglossum simile]